MDTTNESLAKDEIESLRKALDAETDARLEVQRQLERSNQAFEEFVSASAHNMRDSLRDVASNSQLMAETYAGRLDPDGGVMLQRIQQAAVRMQALLSDVVDYWAAGPDECQFSRTDMDAVLRQALLCTDSLILERGAVVTHDSLPAVAGDFAALSKVMHHLLRNAIAYGNASTPHVHISSRWVDPQWEISVRDDGPGIDPEFHARVFSVFKRLHGPERPGNGLGLAFCKKAIEAHGGHIWVESASGAGAAFFFTLPPPD